MPSDWRKRMDRKLLAAKIGFWLFAGLTLAGWLLVVLLGAKAMCGE